MFDMDRFIEKLKAFIARCREKLLKFRFISNPKARLALSSAAAAVAFIALTALILGGSPESTGVEKLDNTDTAEEQTVPDDSSMTAMEAEEAVSERFGYWRKAGISEYNNTQKSVAISKSAAGDSSAADSSAADSSAAESTAETVVPEVFADTPAEPEDTVTDTYTAEDTAADDDIWVNDEVPDDGLDEVLGDDEDTAANETRKLTTIAQTSLRCEPSDGSYIMDTIPAYTELYVSELCEGGEWYVANYNGMDGYVRADALNVPAN